MAKKLKLLTNDELIQCQLRMLDIMDEFCKKHDLTYWLYGGSLLGAVRHKGYIPWDDDLDLAMPLSSYLRFLQLAGEPEGAAFFAERQIRVADISVPSEVPYHQTFAKLYDERTRANKGILAYEREHFQDAVFVDIFPMVGLKGTPEEEKKMRELDSYYAKLRYASEKFIPAAKTEGKKRILKRALGYIPARKKGYKHWLASFNELRDSFPDAFECDVWTCPEDIPARHHMSKDEKTIYLPFEGRMCPAPEHYEEWLVNFYGDYMQLPPEEERVPWHNQDFYWLDGMQPSEPYAPELAKGKAVGPAGASEEPAATVAAADATTATNTAATAQQQGNKAFPAYKPLIDTPFECNAPGTALRDYQLVQLEILKEFMRVCKENNLRWFLSYGSLLGAVRHGGFIPWDDDIDVQMPLEDYWRFREVCHQGALSEGYYFQCHADNVYDQIYQQRIGLLNTTSLPRDYTDVPGMWGVCIDIYPLGAAPAREDKADSKKYDAREKRFDQLASRYYYKKEAQLHGGVRRAYCLFMSRGSDKAHMRAWKRYEHEFLEATDYEHPTCFTGCPGRVTAAIYDETIELPYEGLMVPVPARYADLLNELYGPGWEELPPEEKRVWHSGGGSDEVIVSLTEPWSKYMTNECC